MRSKYLLDAKLISQEAKTAGARPRKPQEEQGNLPTTNCHDPPIEILPSDSDALDLSDKTISERLPSAMPEACLAAEAEGFLSCPPPPQPWAAIIARPSGGMVISFPPGATSMRCTVLNRNRIYILPESKHLARLGPYPAWKEYSGMIAVLSLQNPTPAVELGEQTRGMFATYQTSRLLGLVVCHAEKLTGLFLVTRMQRATPTLLVKPSTSPLSPISKRPATDIRPSCLIKDGVRRRQH